MIQREKVICDQVVVGGKEKGEGEGLFVCLLPQGLDLLNLLGQKLGEALLQGLEQLVSPNYSWIKWCELSYLCLSRVAPRKVKGGGASRETGGSRGSQGGRAHTKRGSHCLCVLSYLCAGQVDHKTNNYKFTV